MDAYKTLLKSPWFLAQELRFIVVAAICHYSEYHIQHATILKMIINVTQLVQTALIKIQIPIVVIKFHLPPLQLDLAVVL